MKFLHFLLAGSVLLAYQPEIEMNPPEYVEEMPARDFVPDFAKPGSLFGQGDKPLFSDRRAMRPYDLITVIINENSSANYSSSKSYNNNSSGNSTSPRLQYNGTDPNRLRQTQDLDDRTNYTMTKPSSNSTFKGGGTQSKSESLSLVITARIVKVLENGNYFIYGKKDILVDGEKQMIEVSGVVRPYDINRDNTVESKYLADAKIQYANVGDLSNTSKKKFATDAMDTEYPY
ncbi:flagellar basal body L-ring protein FlgH [Helicobacter mustelae]|uniref:Flagellar L-ring protein n=1 Tax=Helicobacter mustelae (strain ATCC 43772 / CCUG 25715 / CIP 103759 / LMG 18044 / NCTC 12198 / R85-136P) TaxID=679897 RepID=D3UIV4_HELM1|nr:flagellar basal body L-ring protein FlgH [Helicobacter mustelae]CBG40429.1 putative flagellar L-ring protein precursor [Helicobacter mustelae 12198]SQH71929.1 flagellar L-ring protein precursor [Helicobacter mustelae]STP13070.1 flagellar L-ring protein precursor [Helicobacter mustelae]